MNVEFSECQTYRNSPDNAAHPAGNLLWAALFQKDAVMLNFPNLIEAQTQLKTEASSGITVRRTDRKEPVMAVPHCLVGWPHRPDRPP